MSWALCLAVSLWAAHAIAAERSRSLGLIDPPAWLVRAASLALAPWSFELVTLDGQSPGDDPTVALPRARALASQNHVDGLVWLVDTGGVRGLVVYDAVLDQLTFRSVSAGAVDEAEADALASSIKTTLRVGHASAQDSPAGASPPPSAPEATPPPSTSEAPRAAPSASGGRVSRPPLPGSGNEAPIREEGSFVPLSPWGRFRLEGEIAVRGRPDGGVAFDPRFRVAVGWWPRFARGAAGIMIGVEDGTGSHVVAHEFEGRLQDHALILSLQGRVPVRGRWRLEPAASVTLHWIVLDGQAIDGEGLGDVTRLDAALGGSVFAGYRLGSVLTLGVRLGGSYWTRTQNFTVEGRTAYTMPTWETVVGLVAAAELN